MINALLELVKAKRKIIIQTHNNPDPDTIASAFALKNLLYHVYKKRVTIAYMGVIGRAENKEFVRECGIDLYLMNKLDLSRYDGLIIVDAQPGAGNIYESSRLPDAVIDHHDIQHKFLKNIPFVDVRPHYGSTSTIIAEYYKKLNIVPDKATSTALYYGIKTDTFGAGRSIIQEDIDMLSFILPRASLPKISRIENPELPRYYYKTIKKAVEQSVIIDDLIFCNLDEVRNTELISEISDYFLKMRDVKSTFIIGRIDKTAYFSIRHQTNKKPVGKIALSIVKGIGYGGGHMKSAGGQIPLENKDYNEIVAILKARAIKKFNLKNLEEKQL